MENEKKPRKPRSPLSEESKEKIRQAKLGKKLGPMSAEHRENLSNSAKGKKHTAEAKAKISASKLGKKKTPEHRQKLSAAHMGKVMSSEQKMKHLMTSLNSTKGPMAVETREKISDSHKGKKLSEKTNSDRASLKEALNIFISKENSSPRSEPQPNSSATDIIMLYLLSLIQETRYGKIAITLMTLIKTPVFAHLNLITCTSAGFK